MFALLAALVLGGFLHGSGWLAGEQPSARQTSPGTAQPGSPSSTTAWIDVPFVAQTTDGCGSASLAMVMRYWLAQEHRPPTPASDPQQIQTQLFSRRARGIYASRMTGYLRRSGFAAFPFHGQWSDLKHHIALGRPLILALRDGGPHGPLHYVVAVGIARDFIYLNDPARQRMLRLDRAGLLAEWNATDDWTLLAVPQPAPSDSAPASR